MLKKSFAKCLFYAVMLFYVVFISKTCLYYISHSTYLYQTDLLGSFLTGARVLRGGNGGDLYNFDIQLNYQNKLTAPFIRRTLLPFRNTPLIGFFYIPLTYLTLKNASIVIFAFNFLIIVLFNRIFIKFAGKSDKTRWLWIASFVFWPSISTFLTGQNTGVFLILLALIYSTLLKEKYYLAGIAGSLLLLRPQYILFLPFIFPLIGRKRPFIVGFLIFSLLIIAANIAISGLPALMKYPAFVMSTETPEYGNRLNKITSIYFLLKQIFPNAASYIIESINFIFYALILVLFYIYDRTRSLNKSFIIGVLAISIFSIHSLSHDLIILLIPIYILIAKKKRSLLDNILVLLLFFSPFMVIYVNAVYITVGILSILLLVLIFYPGKEINRKKLNG